MASELETAKPSSAPGGFDPDTIGDLLKRAGKGDKSCLPQLRKLFDDPRQAHLIDAYGSAPAWLEADLLEGVAKDNLAVREGVTRKLAKVRRELEGPNPTPTERLLAERAAMCWWLVNRYESYYAKAGSQAIRAAEYQQRRIDRAHARFLSALKTLATVRKLASPALQINIGANQVNTAST